jgi:DNA-binding transcriptional LysR family regulator
MQINLNQLRTFFLVAREKSLTKAAELSCITQPAVTMQIKALEQSLGIILFRKGGKTLELTDVGEVLLSYATRIFGVVEEMEHVLQGYADLSRGSLTIGTTRSFAGHLMPRLLSLFQERCPKVKVILKEGSSQEIADGLEKFKYDLGVIGRIPERSRLKVIPYTKEEFCLVVPPNHRFAGLKEVSLQELQTEPIIIGESGSGSRHAILTFFEEHQVKPSVLIEAGSVEFIKEYIIKEKGISFLYKPEIQLEAKMGLLKSVAIKEGPIFVQTDIIFSRDLEPSPAVKVFLDLVKAEAA